MKQQDQKLSISTVVFTIAPGGKWIQAIFGATGQTGSLLIFPSQVEAGKPDICNVSGFSKPTYFKKQAVGYLVCPHSLQSKAAPTKKCRPTHQTEKTKQNQNSLEWLWEENNEKQTVKSIEGGLHHRSSKE